MKKTCSVSVVTPLYNDVLTLELALRKVDAVLAKRHISYEIICIDDASCDGSLALAKKLAKKLLHLRIFTHVINLGIARTYRELYAKANGERGVWFSLDGEWDPRDVGRRWDGNEDICSGC